MLLNIGKDGTHYTTSSFTRINLYTFITYVEHQTRDYYVTLTSRDMNDDEFIQTEESEHSSMNVEQEVSLELITSSMPVAIEDYVFRGDRLCNYSLYEMYRDTECVPMSFSEKEKYERSIEERGMHRGRPYNERVMFQALHSRHCSRWTILRSKRSVPYIIGILIKQSSNAES
jgi:hypothetical protein